MNVPPRSGEPLLDVAGLVTGYGDLTIVHGASLTVRRGELVTAIGPNGAGKSTLLKAIAGLLPAHEGTIVLNDGAETVDLTGLTASARARLGVGCLPQVANVFPNLSVLDNLKVGGYLRRRALAEALETTFAEFPFLDERRSQSGGTLSGGQRKLLGLARALMASPKLLLLDEPSAGLSPSAWDVVLAKLVELRDRGLSMILVEQNARRALSLCDYAYVLDMGRNRYEGAGADLLGDDRIVSLYLGSRRAQSS